MTEQFSAPDTVNQAAAGNNYRLFSHLSALVAGLLIPVLLLAFVPVLRRLALGAPGGWVGFRTPTSTSSVANWQLAQSLTAHHFLGLGLSFLAVAAIIYWLLSRFARGNSQVWALVSFALLAVQLVTLGISTFLIERALPAAPPAISAAPVGNWGLPLFFGLLTPVALIFCGPFMHHLANKNPNFVTGYRTPGSMQSPRHWKVANNMAAKVSLWAGVVSTVLALLAFGWLLLDATHTATTWWYVATFFALAPLAALLGTVPVIESRLKRLS